MGVVGFADVHDHTLARHDAAVEEEGAGLTVEEQLVEGGDVEVGGAELQTTLDGVVGGRDLIDAPRLVEVAVGVDPAGDVEGADGVLLLAALGAVAIHAGEEDRRQGRVLQRLLPPFPRRRYLTATATAAAAVGWAVGMSTPLFFVERAFDADASWSATTTTLFFVAFLGALLGLLFGGAPMMAVVVTGAIGGLIAGAWVAVATALVVVHWAMLDDGVTDELPAASSSDEPPAAASPVI